MMTTNLFVIANVKQLRTYVVLEFYCLFFRTSWGVGVLNSAIFNSFHNRVEFGMILEGLRNFGGFQHPKPPPSVCHCCTLSPGLPNWISMFRFPDQNFVRVSLLVHAFYMLHSSVTYCYPLPEQILDPPDCLRRRFCDFWYCPEDRHKNTARNFAQF